MNPRVLYRAASYATDARSAADSVISALTPAAWYRNATGVTESGGFASQWDDYSGNARHLVQGVGTNQPAYAAGVLTFDGLDNYMVASTWLQAQPVSIYIVCKQATWTATDRFFDGTTADSMAVTQITATPTIAPNGVAGLSNGDLAVNTRGIVACVFNGVSSSIRVNNQTKVSGNVGATSPGGFTLGSRAGGGQQGNIAAEEVVIFSAAHDDATQDSVITALNNALTVF